VPLVDIKTNIPSHYPQCRWSISTTNIPNHYPNYYWSIVKTKHSQQILWAPLAINVPG